MGKVAAQPATHDLRVGDILASSWGYDQTNVDFYQVIATTRCQVTLRRIKAHIRESGFMCGYATARRDEFTDAPPIKRKPQRSGAVCISSYEVATAWDGCEKYVSWYA
jgi:hypothetical protein